MLTLNPLREVLRSELTDLAGCAGGVRNADPQSVHEARVASRRLREVLPLFARTHPEQTTSMHSTLHNIGRWLGPVRELDVTAELVERESLRLPFAAPALARLRLTVHQEQRKARRKMIKRLEREALLREAQPFRNGPWSDLCGSWMPPRGWAGTLRERIDDRLARVDEAVAGLSDVYFPNRAHKARIAVKQLRYSLELGHASGLWRIPRMLKALRKMQGTLGDVHDLQVLVDRLDALEETPAAAADAAIVRQALTAEIERIYDHCVARRAALLAIRDACGGLARGHPAARRSLMLASAALSTGILLVRK